MGNLGRYVKNAKKRFRELRDRFLTLGHGEGLGELVAGLSEAEQDLFEERAGILELDGGLTKEEAERAALREVLEYD